jgi:leader peptidase (prepilin peptidase)/N-methyltransferase
VFAFERQFLTEDDISEGLIPEKFHIILTGLFFLIFGALSLASIATAMECLFWGISSLVLARLIALDLTNHTLPNIYIAPLCCFALIGSLTGMLPITWQDALFGGAIAFSSVLALSFLIELLLKSAFLGGGDIKFIGASGLWLGWGLLPFYMMVACFFTIIISFLPSKNNHIAFGPGLCFSLWLFLHQKTYLMVLINKAFAFIS